LVVETVRGGIGVIQQDRCLAYTDDAISGLSSRGRNRLNLTSASREVVALALLPSLESFATSRQKSVRGDTANVKSQSSPSINFLGVNQDQIFTRLV
jgi:hypothetical protein